MDDDQPQPCDRCGEWLPAGVVEGEKEGSMKQRPTIVCLCGSTRFSTAFQEANLRETLFGRIVLSIGCNMRNDTEIFGHLSPEEQARIKAELDELHLRKIDLADEVLVLNVGQYVGDSTRREIAYAKSIGKRIRWLEMQRFCSHGPTQHACRICTTPICNLCGLYSLAGKDYCKAHVPAEGDVLQARAVS